MSIRMKKIFTQKDIEIKTKELSDIINKNFKDKKIVLIGVMNGAFFFIHDIMEKLSIDFQFDILSCSSYYHGRWWRRSDKQAKAKEDRGVLSRLGPGLLVCHREGQYLWQTF